MKITVGIADDHRLLVQALASMISELNHFDAALQACSGNDLLEQLSSQREKPEILIIGVNLRVMDAAETAESIRRNYPGIKTIALCLEEEEQSLIRMIRSGCRGWLFKDMHPKAIEHALLELNKTGYYNADKTNFNFRHLVKIAFKRNEAVKLSETEEIYLSLACTDLTVKQIAEKMNVSERTVHGYFLALFDKLSVESRVGLVLEAFRLEKVLPPGRI